MSALIILLVLIFFAVLIKFTYKYTTKWCRSQTCLSGKTAIVTGANSGIGYQTALDFAKRGARVILACRDRNRSEEARSKIINETGNDNVVVKLIDLSSFKSVRAFAKNINETESRLDILVNNAGVPLGETTTEDGKILIFQVNYFSTFLLTNLLLGLMTKTKTSRIINVTSLLAILSRDFDVNKLDKYPGDWQAYPYSKLCQILFTQELGKKLQGSGITTFAVHPGGVKTSIYNNLSGFMGILCSIIQNWLFITAEEAAQSVIYCAVAQGIEQNSGEIFTNCSKTKRYQVASVPGLAEKLWKLSEETVELRPEEIVL